MMERDSKLITKTYVAELPEFKKCVLLLMRDIRRLRWVWQFPMRINVKYWLLYQAMIHSKQKRHESNDRLIQIDLQSNVRLLREKVKTLEHKIKELGLNKILARSIDRDLLAHVIKKYGYIDLCSMQSVITVCV